VFKQPVYFISDNHFKLKSNSFEKERRNHLYQVFSIIKKTGGTLVIGGDFFDFWFDYKYIVPDNYMDLMDQLENLNKNGIDIYFVLGNHDYWDFGYFQEKFNANVYKNNLEKKYGAYHIQVCHGDGLLKNDTGYRFMKKIIRSKICISLFRILPIRWGYWLASKVSHASETYHHHDNKSDSIKKEMLEYARQQWNRGYTTVLLGHYHQTGIVEENGNYLIFMGDWLRHFTVTRLDENGWWQGSWNEL